MRSLKFKQLLLLSDTNKLANRFNFGEGRNLITANDNTVGKTTIVKLLLWGLGCEPALDSKWASQDCKVIIKFSIEDNIFFVRRYKNLIAIKREEDKVWMQFDKITGGYAMKFAELLSFKALLPNRATGMLETPPPAYYFLPFYIDQKKSWSTAWDNFESLGQYENWKQTIIKYHVGLLSPKHFELSYKKMEIQNRSKNVKENIEKVDVALEIVSKYVPNLTIATIEENKFKEFTDEIRIELKELQTQQEKLLDNFTQNQSEKSYLEQQKAISERIIDELEKDYLFAVENVDNTIECPLCGTIHENSIVYRSSILVDKKQAKNQLEKIEKCLDKVNNTISNINNKLTTVRNKITSINAKYITINDSQVSLNNIIENIAGNSIKDLAISDKEEMIITKTSLDKDVRNLTKEIKGLITKEDAEKISNSFVAILTKYVEIFGAESINFAEIKSPLDYSKIIKEGGAAEGTRAILAYYLAIFTMVTKFGSEVVAPLIIDTPRQQEQSDFNYEKIVSFLTTNVSSEVQILLCAMDNPILESFKENANIIILDNTKLLSAKMYEEVRKEFLSL